METMMVRHCVAILLTVLAVAPAAAGDMTPDDARGFIVGKLFAFTCFDGTRGAGRIYGDGSVAGSVQFSASGPQRNMLLPTGTLRVKGAKVCATRLGLAVTKLKLLLAAVCSAAMASSSCNPPCWLSRTASGRRRPPRFRGASRRPSTAESCRIRRRMDCDDGLRRTKGRMQCHACPRRHRPTQRHQ